MGSQNYELFSKDLSQIIVRGCTVDFATYAILWGSELKLQRFTAKMHLSDYVF